MEGKGVSTYLISQKDIDYNVISRWEGEQKEERKG